MAIGRPKPERYYMLKKIFVCDFQVKLGVYCVYIRSIGYLLSFLFITVYIISSAFGVASNAWLARWSDENGNMKNSTNANIPLNLGVYAGFGVAQGG